MGEALRTSVANSDVILCHKSEADASEAAGRLPACGDGGCASRFLVAAALAHQYCCFAVKATRACYLQPVDRTCIPQLEPASQNTSVASF